MDIWTPTIDDCLTLECEETNSFDPNAVSVKLEDSVIVGHVPFNLAPILSQFLRINCNRGIGKVTAEKVNRGAGYGLEIPCL